MSSTNQPIQINPNPLVTPVTELIDILANIVEIGGISVIASERENTKIENRTQQLLIC